MIVKTHTDDELMEISLGQRPSLVDAVPDSDAVGSDDPVDRGPFDAVFPIVAIDRISNSFGQQNQQDIIIRRPKSMATSFTHSLALAHTDRIEISHGINRRRLWARLYYTNTPVLLFFFLCVSVCQCVRVCICL